MNLTQTTCPSMGLNELFRPQRIGHHWEVSIKTLQFDLAWRFDRLAPPFPLWCVFGLAALVDGFTIARIGTHGFRYPSPIGYLSGLWLFGLSSLGMIVLPVIPVVIPMPCFSLLALSMSGGLMLSARNLQKRL
jgi:hypothetical protein